LVSTDIMAKAMVLTRPGSIDNLEMREYPTPSAGPGDIVADVRMCTICGTDIDIIHGGQELPMPILLGHEWFGTVRELGEEVTTDYIGQELKEGDLVATSNGTRGECWYLNNVPGRNNLCPQQEVVGVYRRSADEAPHFWGAFAQHVYIEGHIPAFKLPAGLEERELVCLEPIAVATRSFKRAHGSGSSGAGAGEGVDPSQTVVIQGLGSIGQCMALVCNVNGMENIIAVDRHPDRIRMGGRMGVTDIVDRGALRTVEERAKEVRRLTGGRGADIVFECAGTNQAFAEAFKLVRKGGTVIELGVAGDKGTIEVNPFSDFCEKEVSVFGVFGYPSLEYRMAIATMKVAKRRGIPFGDIVSDVQPLESLPEQIRRHEERDVPGSIAIRP
jgi:L-iditol 2-dehydrogenase